jgi:hypothetical protein
VIRALQKESTHSLYRTINCNEEQKVLKREYQHNIQTFEYQPQTFNTPLRKPLPSSVISWSLTLLILVWRYTATKLVDALHHILEGWGFDYQWVLWYNKCEEVPSERRQDIAQKGKFCISTLKYLPFANVYTSYVANVCGSPDTKFHILS